ncbi:5-demethoxyubiquinone hydroxylase, mitochondrial-like [Rhopilema esculentum]|uniref:5-demethoxyubiquinone hydroxylase, mitochondrial-like n=1 Tax=Rhopilema esculentum TaxID=499914 RepID=UPI0031E1C77F
MATIALRRRVAYDCQIICRCLCSNATKAEKSNRMNTKELVDKIIRVDHAGEYGADRIYAGQMAILGRDGSTGELIQKMWDDEKAHLRKMKSLMIENRVRPTFLLPFWNIAGFALGAGTAMLGKEAAMACTIAVEEVIGDHYDSQLRELLSDDPETHKELLEIIHKFRDEEMEHHDIGKEQDGEKAPFYSVMKAVIQTGCRTAIWLSERI